MGDDGRKEGGEVIRWMEKERGGRERWGEREIERQEKGRGRGERKREWGEEREGEGETERRRVGSTNMHTYAEKGGRRESEWHCARQISAAREKPESRQRSVGASPGHARGWAIPTPSEGSA